MTFSRARPQHRRLPHRGWQEAEISMTNSILQIDDYDLTHFTDVAAGFGQKLYSYVVTPNADHLIRLDDDPAFRTTYAEAGFVLLDSRLLSHIVRFTRGLRLPVCTGSDLTANLFANVITADDPIVLIGCSDKQASSLAKLYGLNRLAHLNPPMGFVHDAASVEDVLRFVELHSPFRFCFLAVGAPQQELLASQLKQRGIARGLALCVGASINFITGEERRAPSWIQHIGMEWMYRLMQAPGRLAHRYLVRCPRIFGLLRHITIALRPAMIAPLVRTPPSSFLEGSARTVLH